MKTRFTAIGLILAFALAACSGGGGGNPMPNATPTPTPTPTPPPQNCSQTQSLFGANAAASAIGGTIGRRPLSRAESQPQYVPDELAVTYSRPSFAAVHVQVEGMLAAHSASVVHRLDYPAIGKVTQIVRVPVSQLVATQALLESQPGASVSRVAYRQTLSANALFPSDPYFDGFAVTNGTPPPAPTNNDPPYYESSNVPGQWDMHVISVAKAWGYSQPNTTGSIYSGAIGSTGVSIAVVDTGAYVQHPELSGKIVYAETDLNGSVCPNDAASMVDMDGHGTNVAGIAAGATNNALGFASAGYSTSLMIFRVFPKPPAGGCPPNSTNSQCEASTVDIANAINDAVTKGARVINISLGGPTADPTEENAVANAIASNVTVVAAAGNEKTAKLDYPAADAGVIAVGASALNDSIPSAPFEYVASYSNYGSGNWGLVAPGGDPSSDTDADDLHWIENIDTTSQFDPASTCKGDYPTETGTPDCRVLIAGTSQAAPHVSGVAALLLAVKPSLTPGQVFQILCSTSDNINDPKQGCGRLDAYRAMASAVGDPSP